MVKSRLVKLQSVIFTPHLNLTNKLSLINWFSEAIPGIFDGEPISIPVPQETPPEIPRIILQSKDNSWNLHISLLRTDLVFLSIPEDSRTIPIEEFIETSKKLFSEYKEKYDVFIQRLALVTERVLVDLDKTPGEYATERFCKEKFAKYSDKPEERGAFVHSKSFEIHNLKKYFHKDSGFDINSWVRVKATTLKGQKDQPVLLVENDINTQQGKVGPEGYSSENINTFFTESPKEIDQILHLYIEE